MQYTLVFSAGQAMRNFVDTLGGIYSEVNFHTLTVICECTEEDVDRAVYEYGAKVVDKNLA